MDQLETSEGADRPNLDDINKKIDLARKARLETEAKIMSRESFTLEEVVSLAVANRAYVVEVYLYELDLVGREDPDAERTKRLREHLNHVRMESEKALTNALRGNYQDLKDIFKGYASPIDAEARLIGDSAEIQHKRSQYQKLVDAIPDKGAPVTLPLPSWKDPRFNWEQDQKS